MKFLQKWLYRRRTRKLFNQPLRASTSNIFSYLNEHDIIASTNEDRLKLHRDNRSAMSKTRGK